MRSFLITFMCFSPYIGEKTLLQGEVRIDWGPIVLGLKNHRFISDFFQDSLIAGKYWEKIKNDSLDKIVFIDIDNQKLSVLDFTDTFRVVLETKVSSGRQGYSTPIGEFKVTKKRVSRVSKKYGGTMLYWNCLVPDESIGIHGLDEVGYEKKLGRRASHGCIRVSNSVAQDFYKLAPIGTLVLID